MSLLVENSTYAYNKALARNVNLNQQQKPYFLQKRYDYPKQSPIVITGYNKGDGASGDQITLNPNFINKGITSGAHNFRPMVTHYGFNCNMNRPIPASIIDPSMDRETPITPKVPQIISAEPKRLNQKNFPRNVASKYPITAKTGFQNILPIEIPKIDPADPVYVEAEALATLEAQKEAIENSKQASSVKPSNLKFSANTLVQPRIPQAVRKAQFHNTGRVNFF